MWWNLKSLYVGIPLFIANYNSPLSSIISYVTVCWISICYVSFQIHTLWVSTGIDSEGTHMCISKTKKEKFHLIQWIMPEAISSDMTFLNLTLIYFFLLTLKRLTVNIICVNALSSLKWMALFALGVVVGVTQTTQPLEQRWLMKAKSCVWCGLRTIFPLVEPACTLEGGILDLGSLWPNRLPTSGYSSTQSSQSFFP